MDDAADLVKRFAELPQDLRDGANCTRGRDQNHTDAEIKCSAEILFGNVAKALQEVEDGLARPGLELDFGGAVIGKNARNVVRQATAGDVRGSF